MSGPLNRIDGVVYATPEEAAFYSGCKAWERRTLGDALRQAAKAVPERTAYVCNERRISFAELDAITDRLAAALRGLGLQLHDRAMFQMGTSIEAVIALFGCFKAGVIPVCSIPQFREIEIGTLARLTQPKGYFVQADAGGRFDLVSFAGTMALRHGIPHVISTGNNPGAGVHSLEALCAAVPQAAALDTSEEFGCEDVVAFQLSGGSTGVPKIIPRFHAEYLGHVRFWCDRYDMSEGSVGIWALPILHNAGMMFSVLRAVLYRATTVLLPNWDVANYFKMIEQERVQHAFTIGPHAPAIASYPHVQRHDLSSLKCLFTLMGAEAIERATGIRSINMFGITEGLVLTGTPDSPPEIRFGSVGMRCSTHDEVRLLHPQGTEEVPLGEAGELCFKGPSSLRGYYAAPNVNAASFTPDGFFRTGDMMRAREVDDEIVYCFEGRMRDNINRGGEKFGTEDIEHLIARHPAIADGKVVAMPDEIYGEKACAFLIVREGFKAPTVGELGEYLLAKGLAKYKLPERIETCGSFPVTRVGKLDRAALRSQIAKTLAEEARSQANTHS
ncbi:AMP-binding protein [Pusillimonas noertemannii]|uniref:Non-ribosomal peptide synthetase component E (Peptide arylation enzyme) n=1 Tax=Pusillimonas noertemannii TaxID=305977 RepID=A0A2U1CQV7_9BURK|nr:AMP-binding protein [Pusillimonas noertemannii]NYT67610.1 AMP-binding protein [Pusillimonas noertemannii]PVY68282.1 non-ribosomal peptide synthetase component E (peptide arylation enzyme) [Pusillimonas noertemannii]TFL12224.1 (2,3-dihydroxybenzoyl)adenylate synthase [Pusillimonas noertemannii]